MILTLTVNPAIDRNIVTDRLVFEDRSYILSTSESAGGRGINASCVIQAFGGQTRAIVTSGGKTGARLEQYLCGYGFPVEIVRIRNPIRTNLTITDKTGLTIKLNELGPRLSRSELARLEQAVQTHLQEASWLMLCGSLPPGVPGSFYARLIEAARARGVRTLLDTDGEGLQAGIEARPTVVTPNQQEAERLLNKALLTRAHWVEAAERIRRLGAESVVLSLGSRGALGAQDQRIVEAVPPAIEVVCPIGAGDALAAAFVWAMTEGKDFASALRWGVAAGTASARLPGLKFATLEQTREIYNDVELRVI
ncbi:MAG: 1-phosphofructokinase family hexose kinase [Bryobacterales bacterium]|nr:1-phosphofructokinase family hexose kinase [Bryobacteraceae bacterium]MDW8354900.1 1-phosphofructokinase family hexose kinase [Bryobacterales bacterium]